MTRETKLGLVVAGSFLALVGGVVVARLRQIDMPGEPEASATGELNPAVAEAATSPPPAPEPKKLKNQVSSDVLANAGGAKMPSAEKTPDPFPAPAAVVTPPPAPAQTDPQPAAPAKVVVPPMKSAEPVVPVEPSPDPAQFVGPPAPPEGTVSPTPVVVNPTLTAPDPKPAVPPAAADTPPPAPAAVTTLPDKPAEPVPVAVQPSPTVPVPIPAMPDPPPATPPKPEPPAPVVKQAPVADAPGAPPPLNPNVANNAVPTMTKIPGPEVVPSGATLEPPRVPAAGPAREPFAAPPRPATPPEPKRDSYLEEQYRWSAGDNFAALSTKNYGTPKYADALLKYNQDYPLASREIRQTPPAVAPGQVLWVPPVRILERDYADHISGLTPIVTPATPTARPTVEPVAPPPGLANSGFGNPAGQLYRVRAPGESVQEIARRTLGNSGLATRVQGLNPTLSPDPRLPIPAGTVLRLPGEAKVDVADRP
jgi:hypothetical protein